MTKSETKKPLKRPTLHMTKSPALLFAALLAARNAGDEVLAAGCEFDLRELYGVTVQFAERAGGASR